MSLTTPLPGVELLEGIIEIIHMFYDADIRDNLGAETAPAKLVEGIYRLTASSKWTIISAP